MNRKLIRPDLTEIKEQFHSTGEASRACASPSPRSRPTPRASIT